ncbi:MAG: signal peptidase II [Proteobacteria bacterium]|nr:signal peptidase II [Pseudomonadota bacterium]
MLILALTFGLDRLSKAQVEFFASLGSIGPVRFASHFNPGFILQTFEEVNPLARIVFVCSLYGFLFFGYFFLEWFLPKDEAGIKASVTVFFGAITGNAWDRAFSGAVSDFIEFRFGDQLVYFNFADVFMWVGVAGIFFFLIRASRSGRSRRSKRNRFVVDESYQLRSAFLMALIAFSMMLILSVFGFTYIRSLGVTDSRALAFLLSGSALGLVFTAVAFLAGVVISHRSAGPLYAFERFVEALLRGERPKFKLRKHDEHRHLIEVAKKLSEQIHKKAG